MANKKGYNFFKTGSQVIAEDIPVKILKTKTQAVSTRKLPEAIKTTVAPGVRETQPTVGNTWLSNLKDDLKMVTPDFDFEVIPIIRYLCGINPDFSQALDNVVSLANTGHKVSFDPNVKPEIADKMRKHLLTASKNWTAGMGIAGMDGLVTKLLSQLMISGALAAEKVVRIDFQGLASIALANPETIRVGYDKSKGRYKYFQKKQNNILEDNVSFTQGELKDLNEYTFVYLGLNGDTDVPYGKPPYLPALKPKAIQSKMLDNIEFIVEQMGLIGFLQVLLDKPEPEDGKQNTTKYRAYLKSYLEEAKTQVQKGFRDGVSVGYKGDHEFEFHSATKSVSGVTELFQENELQLISGLKADGSMLGRAYSTSESQISVVFLKMISQLKNIQNIVKYFLEDVYATELKLGGFKFDYLNVKFEPSTLLDEMKYQQGLQVKIANVQAKYLMGIINQDQAADELGYEKPDQEEPRKVDDLTGKLVDKQKRNDQKTKSAKKSRRKKEAAPKSPEDTRTRKKDAK